MRTLKKLPQNRRPQNRRRRTGTVSAPSKERMADVEAAAAAWGGRRLEPRGALEVEVVEEEVRPVLK